LEYEEPQAGSTYSANLSIPVRVRVMLDTKPFASPGPNDQLEATVRLMTADGQTPDMQFLHPSGDGIYSATVTAATGGAYLSQAQLRYTSASGERFEDIAQVAFDVAGTAQAVTLPATPTAPAPTATPVPQESVPQQITMTYDFTWLYIALAVFAVILLGSLLVVAGALRDLRFTYQQANPPHDDVLNSRPGFDTNVHNLAAKGWQDVAAQVVADALQQTVSVDSAVGILDASAEPCPKYTLKTCDGHEITFTTNVRMLRQMKLVHRRDKVVDVSALSSTRHADAGMLWRFALAARGQTNVASPAWAHWYIVVRSPGARTAGMRAVTRRRNLLQRIFRPMRGGL
jgi:hypothetical protein